MNPDAVVQLAERIAQLDRLENEIAALRSALAAANEALERRQKDDRRLRILAARATAEARAAGLRDIDRLRVEFQHRLDAAAADLEAQRALAAAVMFERDQVLTSAAWRATWPLRKGVDFIPSGVRRWLRACVKVVWWTVTGQLAQRLARRTAHFEALRASPQELPVPDTEDDAQAEDGPAVCSAPLTAPDPGAPSIPELDQQADSAPPVELLLQGRFEALSPVPMFPSPDGGRRLTVMLDCLDPSVVLTEDGVALVLGALLAERCGAELRVATRSNSDDGLGLVGDVLAMNGVSWDGEVSWVHAPGGPTGGEAAVGPGDRFLAASWQGAWAASRSVPPNRVALVMARDERDLLPLGDDRLRCQEALALPGLRLIASSPALLESLHREGLAAHRAPFERAFPPSPWAIDAKAEGAKFDFILFGGPDDRGGLYWRSLEALALSLREGVFDPRMWDFTFVGVTAQDVVLPFGIRPRIVQAPGPRDYAAIVGLADLGLCLAGASHHALAIAASGGVGIASRPILDWPATSANILAVDADLASVEQGIRRGASLAADIAVRGSNFEQSRFQRDWRAALAPALEHLGRWFDT